MKDIEKRLDTLRKLIALLPLVLVYTFLSAYSLSDSNLVSNVVLLMTLLFLFVFVVIGVYTYFIGRAYKDVRKAVAILAVEIYNENDEEDTI